MSKETYKNENDFFDSILGGDEYGRFFMSDEDADDYEKKEKKAKKKKKLKKQLKKLGQIGRASCRERVCAVV